MTSHWPLTEVHATYLRHINASTTSCARWVRLTSREKRPFDNACCKYFSAHADESWFFSFPRIQRFHMQKGEILIKSSLFAPPASTWRHNDVILTSMRRNDIASTSFWRHMPAGTWRPFSAISQSSQSLYHGKTCPLDYVEFAEGLATQRYRLWN